MNSFETILAGTAVAVREVACELIGDGLVSGLSDDELTALVVRAGAVLRGVEAILIEAAGEVQARSMTPAREERFAVKRGCHNAVEFLQRASGVGGAAPAWVRASALVRAGASALTGEVLPAPLPAVRKAFGAGTLSADALLAVAPVVTAGKGASVEMRELADASLAELATGAAGDGTGVVVTAAQMRMHASVWHVLLDQDGPRPAEDTGARRGLTLTPAGDGYTKISGVLVPEVGAVLRRIIDASTSPRTRPVAFRESLTSSDAPTDARTPAHKRHDALASALMIAAKSADMPSVAGAAPTLVVHVNEQAMLTGSGHAFIDGAPVSTAVARHAACNGTIHRVTLTAAGRIRQIRTTGRVFNTHQRRAIEARDGGCVIPGCEVPASWCEIHHVTEWVYGGETHTDNGVLLCWHHHRYLDANGWSIRMKEGTPQTRAPAWIDPHRQWRTPPPPPHRTTKPT